MVATKKEQRSPTERVTGDSYMIKILDSINNKAWADRIIKMKPGYTGKALDAKKIADAIGVNDTSNASFQKNLFRCEEKGFLLRINSKAHLMKFFHPRGDSKYFSPPSYVLTEKGLLCAKAISYCNGFDKMSDVLKAELDNTDEKNEKIIKFIDENLGEMDNIFRMLKSLPSLNLDDNEIIEEIEDD
jgi:hypothetical protein